MRDLLEIASKKFNQTYGCLSIYQHGFYFIDIPRTSSSSIKSELGKKFGKAYGKRNVTEKEHATTQIFDDHITAREMRKILGSRIWKKIFTFTIVRNPWDRTYSMYHYRRMKGKVPIEWSFREYVLALGMSDSDNPFFRFHGSRYGLSDYILGENGEIIVDFIARYENRQDDLKIISSHIKYDGLGMLCIQRAKPDDIHYSKFYDSETKEIIRRLYAKDIELFGYEFE